MTRSVIKSDLVGTGINVSKDTISRALYRTGFHSRSPRKVPLLKNQTRQRAIKMCQNLWKERFAVLGKGNLVGWNESWTIRKEHSDKCSAKKWHCLQESTIPSPQLSLGLVPLWYGDAFPPRSQMSYKLSMVE